MKKSKNIHWILSLLAAATVLITGCAFSGAHSAQNTAPRDILARIGDRVITLSEFEEKLEAMPPQYRERLKSKEEKTKFLEGQVEMSLFSLKAREEKIDKENLIISRIRDEEDKLLGREYIKRNIVDKIAVTDDEAKEYYETHVKEFTRPEKVRARHILIKVNPEAGPEEWDKALVKVKELKNRLDKGADFAGLAKKNSDDPGSKNKGGNLGFFTREKMAPEFSEAAFSLKLGEISDPVKTSYGYHIIKVGARNPKTRMSLDQVEGRIKSNLWKEKYRDNVKEMTEGLKEKYKVILNPELLNP